MPQQQQLPSSQLLNQVKNFIKKEGTGIIFVYILGINYLVAWFKRMILPADAVIVWLRSNHNFLFGLV